MRVSHLGLAALLFALAPSLALAKVDPLAVVGEAYESYKKNNDYEQVRGILSRALREGAKDGPLNPDFTVIYMMYADVARFAGNPAFALQLAEQGLSLALSEVPVDEDSKNALLVSRAYALADLGRYDEAVEAVRITAVWMGQRFGQSSRDDLEKEAAGWANKAAVMDKTYAIPSIAEVSLGLMEKGIAALNRGDPEEARQAASRGLLPEGTGISALDLRMMNARFYFILGISYNLENRAQLSISQLRRALDLIVAEPWDGKSKAVLRKDVVGEPDGPRLVYDVFYNLADSASKGKDGALTTAALDVATDYALTPSQRFGILAQRAAVDFAAKNFAEAERKFADAVVNARQAGDEKNARLAEFYVAVARLNLGAKSADAPALAALREKAQLAAEAAGNDLWTADFVMSTAVRMSYFYRFENADAAPLAARAFDVFVARQHQLAGQEDSQDYQRRERRVFLETVIGSSYADGEKSSAGGADARPQAVSAPK